MIVSTPNSRYTNRIKVVCDDLMCFPVLQETYEPTGVSYYDAYALSDPDPVPIETISYNEWLYIRNQINYSKMYAGIFE